MDDRLAALDIGTKRIGVAVSDGLGLTAQPLCVIARRGTTADIEQIRVALANYAVRRVVVGLPLQMDGSEGSQAELVRRFCERLETATGWEVLYQDERLTTVESERRLIDAGLRRKARRRVIDKTAAALILQSYLDAGGRIP